MKYLVMIQARCGSTRLPNKVLMDLCGKPALQRMIERVQRSRMADEVMVVTSINKNNLPIVKLCAELGVRVGIGSEEDVLDRYYQTARLIRPEYVIRLTADCPCFDPELLDQAIESMEEDVDYLRFEPDSFADGLDLEIVSYDALARSWREAKHSFEREHVTQYVDRHPELFKKSEFPSPVGKFGDQRWTVDEPEDFQVVEHIYSHFLGMGKEDFTYREILDYMKEHPEIRKLNEKYSRNEGLQKSIENDVLITESFEDVDSVTG